MTTTPTEKPHVRVMSSITVSYPPKRPMAHCEFSVRCKKAKLDHRRKAVCIVSINGSGPHVEWGCVSCSRVVVLKHMARLSRFQGFLIDSLNKINADDVFRKGISLEHNVLPPQVSIHFPTSNDMKRAMGHEDPNESPSDGYTRSEAVGEEVSEEEE